MFGKPHSQPPITAASSGGISVGGTATQQPKPPASPAAAAIGTAISELSFCPQSTPTSATNVAAMASPQFAANPFAKLSFSAAGNSQKLLMSTPGLGQPAAAKKSESFG